MIFLLVYGAVMLLLLNTLWIDIDEWNKRQITEEFYNIAVAISVIIYYRSPRLKPWCSFSFCNKFFPNGKNLNIASLQPRVLRGFRFLEIEHFSIKTFSVNGVKSSIPSNPVEQQAIELKEYLLKILRNKCLQLLP